MISRAKLLEYAKVIQEADSSGMDSQTFAASRGIRAQKLYTMRWLLRKHGGDLAATEQQAAEKDTSYNVLPRTKGMVVGYREAARVLGVKESYVRNRIRQLRHSNQLNLKVGLSDAGQTGYAWESESAVLTWWNAHSKPGTEIVKATEPVHVVKRAETVENTLEKVFLPSLYADLQRIHQKFNAASQKLLRKQRGEVEEITIEEVINLVMGVGLANWMED